MSRGRRRRGNATPALSRGGFAVTEGISRDIGRFIIFATRATSRAVNEMSEIFAARDAKKEDARCKMRDAQRQINGRRRARRKLLAKLEFLR